MTPNTGRGLWSWEQPLALPAPLGEERRAQGMSEPARMCQPGRGHRCPGRHAEWPPVCSKLFTFVSPDVQQLRAEMMRTHILPKALTEFPLHFRMPSGPRDTHMYLPL